MENNFRVLHENNIGYVATCLNCDKIHVEIGNFMSIVSEDSFQMIVKDFRAKSKYKKFYLSETPSGYKLMIQVTNTTFITLSEAEFDSTLELLEMSEHLMKVLQIIDC